MKKSATLLLICLITSGDALAHRDRILTVANDGTLSEIPAEFAPAKLEVKFSEKASNSQPINSVILELKGRRQVLPACVTSLLQSQKMEEVMVSGSWNHDESLVPYYLHLAFFDPGYSVKRWANSGVILLFNLRTGKLIHIKTQVVRDKGKSIQNLPIELATRCSPDELSPISDSFLNK